MPYTALFAYEQAASTFGLVYVFVVIGTHSAKNIHSPNHNNKLQLGNLAEFNLVYPCLIGLPLHGIMINVYLKIRSTSNIRYQ